MGSGKVGAVNGWLVFGFSWVGRNKVVHHLQALIDGMNQHHQKERAGSQMTLGALIERLEALDPNLEMDGLSDAHSYRGYYCDLAFEQVGKKKVSEVLATVKACLGETFTGYKGGDYDMGRQTPVWVSSYGCCGNRIVAVSDSGEVATEPDE